MTRDKLINNALPTTRMTRGLFRACLCVGLLLSCTAVGGNVLGGEQHIHTTLGELLGEDAAARYDKIIKPDEALDWEVYLPTPDPDKLPGVLVYISPVASGSIPSHWRGVMDELNMIYIAADDSGNKVRTIERMVKAVMAVQALGKRFAFDPDSIFVSGFSGGGRVASRVATQYPGAFSGALYICGVDPLEAKHTPDIQRAMQSRFVFLTGSRDFNRSETRTVFKRYNEAGAQDTKLMVIPGMAHDLPSTEAMTEALGFLLGDGP